jgi:hypothetical protein
MIVILNTLTNERWDLPNPAAASTLQLGAHPYAPGLYSVRNGSGFALTVVYGSLMVATVAAGSARRVNTNENLYSWLQVEHDYSGALA